MWVACKTKVTYVTPSQTGEQGTARCHPNPVTQSHRKEGTENTPTHPHPHTHQLGRGWEQQHPQIYKCRKMMGEHLNSLWSPPHTGPGTATYISKASFLEGRKKMNSVSGARRCILGQPSISRWDSLP